MPIDQQAWNKAIQAALDPHKWKPQPVAGKQVTVRGAALKGDFVCGGVFVEVEFGNVASVYRDLLKFQVASREGTGKLAVLVTATARVARFFDQGVATYDYLKTLKEYLAISIQMPIWLIGLDIEDWDPIRNRYAAMKRVASKNGVECHTFESVFGGMEDSALNDGD
jgi:hypothetical protein